MKKERLACPMFFDVAFGRKIVSHLGGNPSDIQDGWCWQDFGERFPELRAKAEKYFASAKKGNPAWAAYWMARACGSEQIWAEKIEKIRQASLTASAQ